MDCVYTKENLSCKPIILNEDISNEDGFCSSTSLHWRIFPSKVATFMVEFSSSAIMWVVVQKHKLILSIFTLLFAHWIGTTDIDPPSFPLNAIIITWFIILSTIYWGNYESLGIIIWYNYLPLGKIRSILMSIGQGFPI